MRLETPIKNLDDNDLKSSEDLERKWYIAQDQPTAILRAQKIAEIPWVLAEIKRYIGLRGNVLDLSCGVGLNSNAVAQAGYQICAIDLSVSALRIAKARDTTGQVEYVIGDAYRSPYPSEHFDVVLAIDLLNNVSDPQAILAEAYRVLKPGGLFIYNSFNKNFLSWIFIYQLTKRIFVDRNPDFLIYSLFLKPQNIQNWLEELGMENLNTCGLRPQISIFSTIKLLRLGFVPREFSFRLTSSLRLSYLGSAKKMVEQ
jgi:2-polyprenyl-6-hydroxyphenyl methylase/3-demethylubiquinone-9 3-methyltransferase